MPVFPAPVAPVLNEMQSAYGDTPNPKEGNRVAHSAQPSNWRSCWDLFPGAAPGPGSILVGGFAVGVSL